ncbi:hypothetical protein L208DRAFT_1284051, partial [Tricholoma matsutake]
AFEEAAQIVHSKIDHQNWIWMKSIIDQKLGNFVIDFVADIHHCESTGQKWDTMWAEGRGKVEKQRVQNTMGYHTQEA